MNNNSLKRKPKGTSKIKRSLASLVIREMQVKTISHFSDWQKF